MITSNQIVMIWEFIVEWLISIYEDYLNEIVRAMIATRNLLYVYVIVSFSYVMWQRHEPYRLGRGWSNGLGSDSHMIFESDVATWISKGIRISLTTVHIGKTSTMWNIWFLYVNNVLLLTANNNRGRTNIFFIGYVEAMDLPSIYAIFYDNVL